MSALPPKADIGTQSWNLRFVPKATLAALRLSEKIPSPLAKRFHRTRVKIDKIAEGYRINTNQVFQERRPL